MVLTKEAHERALHKYTKENNPSTDEIIAFCQGLSKGIELAEAYNKANNQFNGFLNNLKN